MAGSTTIAPRGVAYSVNGLARVTWGISAVDAVVEAVERRGAERVVIVTSPFLARASSVPSQTVDALGARCAGHPSGSLVRLIMTIEGVLK